MRILTPCLIMLGTLVWPGMGLAIDFNNGSAKTSFDYPSECVYDYLGSGCDLVANDGVRWWVGTTNCVGGNCTSATAAANMPQGDGGLGARFWVGERFQNDNSNSIRIPFPSQEKEIWMRYYIRYQAGFKWAGGTPNYDKPLYMRVATGYSGAQSSMSILPQFAGNGQYSLTILSGGSTYQAVSGGVTWQDVFGTVSDGLWHMFETHIKLDTDSTDGIARAWIDGVLVIDENDIDYSGGEVISRDGILFVDLRTNQHLPDNGLGTFMYVDIDDIDIWNKTPPNTDPNSGLPWIGPLNGFSGAGLLLRPKTPAPVGVSFYDPIEDSNFASRGWYDKTSMVLVNSGATSRSTKPIE